MQLWGGARSGFIPVMAMGLLVLTGCASGGRPSLTDRQIDRALVGAPGEAQPSRIVASEIAFARSARETGQWAAFGVAAAPGAVVHGVEGPMNAAIWLLQQKEPAKPTDWRPRAVWMSCDGAMAVSQNRFRDAGGLVGDMITVWQRSRDGSYRWSYLVAAPDMPQPPRRPDLGPVGDGDIVVSALDSIKGIVADCPETGFGSDVGTGTPNPPASAQNISAGMQQGLLNSADGTMRIVWNHFPDGARQITVDYARDGAWTRALDRTFAVAKGTVRQ